MDITRQQAVDFWRGILQDVGFGQLMVLVTGLMMYRADPELFDALLGQTQDVPELSDQATAHQAAVDREVAALRDILMERHEPAHEG